MLSTHEIFERLEGYRAVAVDADSGWAVCWSGGTSFDAMRVSEPDAGLVVSNWNLAGDDQGRVTTDEAIDEMHDALRSRSFLAVSSYESYYVPEPEECDHSGARYDAVENGVLRWYCALCDEQTGATPLGTDA